MWHAWIDEQKQQFVIEDRNGELIAIRPMPTQNFPNPGREKLMAMAMNTEAWERVLELVESANKGR